MQIMTCWIWLRIVDTRTSGTSMSLLLLIQKLLNFLAKLFSFPFQEDFRVEMVDTMHDMTQLMTGR